jgi:biopolymer transport protein TolQ
MQLTQDLSFIGLISNASILVQLVMALLLLVSLLSWWFIFLKIFAIKLEAQQTEAFEKDFWSGGNLNELYQSASNSRRDSGTLEKIFEAGYREYAKLKKQTGIDANSIMESTRRAMRAAYQRNIDKLESHLSFLATVGSVSPYVGLFGTVWGIMNAFRGLSNVSQATIAHVAPGIAEALIATAMGLFAAIPAVVAYNHFAHDINRLATSFESFMEEFSNVLQRQAGSK